MLFPVGNMKFHPLLVLPWKNLLAFPSKNHLVPLGKTPSNANASITFTLTATGILLKSNLFSVL